MTEIFPALICADAPNVFWLDLPIAIDFLKDENLFFLNNPRENFFGGTKQCEC